MGYSSSSEEEEEDSEAAAATQSQSCSPKKKEKDGFPMPKKAKMEEYVSKTRCVCCYSYSICSKRLQNDLKCRNVKSFIPTSFNSLKYQ